jgi:hypothetical protein
MTIQHPCHGLSRAERNAFEAIAINLKPKCSARTIQRLLERGLIAKQEKSVHFSDGLPPLVVDDFYVPLPVHLQWCEWGAERYG